MKRSQIILSLFLALPLLYFLADGPQNPDGAELLVVALRGGVPHSLGFPVLCWINRFSLAFSAFFFNGLNAATVLSAVSWAFHTGAIFFLMRTLQLLGCGLLIQVFSGILACYLPILSAMGIQPEKYAYFFFLMNLFLFSSLSLLKGQDLPSRRSFLFLGLSMGLSLAHHEAALGLLFSALVIPFFLKKKGSLKSSHFFWTLFPTLAIPLAAFSTLPWLRGPHVWVDWGNLKTFREILPFLFVKNFGHTQDLFSDSFLERMNFQVLENLFTDLFEVFSFSLFPLFLLGILALFRSKKPELILLSLYFLAMAFMVSTVKIGEALESLSYRERYVIFPLLPVLIPIFLGIREFWNWGIKRRLLRIGLVVIFTVFGIRHLKMAYEVNGFFSEEILHLYRKSLARELEPGALFVSRDDWIFFYGIPYPGPQDFFYPLVDYFSYPWYRYHVALGLEPRLQGLYKSLNQKNSWSLVDLIQEAFRQGLPVVSTNYEYLMGFHPQVVRKGFLWVARKGASGTTKKEAALRICQDLETMTQFLPKKRNYSTRLLFNLTEGVFWDLGLALSIANNHVGAKLAMNLAKSLQPGEGSAMWVHHCQELKKVLSPTSTVELKARPDKSKNALPTL